MGTIIIGAITGLLILALIIYTIKHWGKYCSVWRNQTYIDITEITWELLQGSCEWRGDDLLQS